MSAIEENEISVNANGGTEITKRLVGEMIPADLAEHFQIIPSRVRELKEDKIRIYWAHDLPNDPECAKFADENYRNKFHKIVFVSNWQMNEFINRLGIPFDEKLHVIENAVNPIDLIEKPKDKINLIYFSTPHRGLELLVPVFEELAKHHDNIHLDVFSSFKIYGWDEADKHYEPVYDSIRNHPQMTYHGYVANEALREYIQKAHILAYPCIWPETSCRVLIESMSAGVFCIHPNLAALPETSGGVTFMYPFNQNPNLHSVTFYKYLERAINDIQEEKIQNYLKFVKAYVDSRYNLKNIGFQWTSLLMDLQSKYPDVESRKFKEDMFVYKV
jgi:glycosyltransferase involved in cell wall biosynthesis